MVTLECLSTGSVTKIDSSSALLLLLLLLLSFFLFFYFHSVSGLSSTWQVSTIAAVQGANAEQNSGIVVTTSSQCFIMMKAFKFSFKS
ncbi:hypothetical protein GGI35DRAFT_447049 [Trichoderma velutinum]